MLQSPISGRAWPTSGAGAFGVARDGGRRKHNGVDFAAREGTPVWSVGSGVIEHVAQPGTDGFSGYGRAVVVRMGDGTRALYAHLGSASVDVGQAVGAGQQIGTVGRTCGTREEPSKLCRGAHLHFELCDRAYPVAADYPRIDPLRYTMPDPQTQLPRDSIERWHALDRAISKLYNAIPEANRAGAPTDMLNAWKEAYEFAPAMGGAMRGAALSDWIERYNAAREQFIAAGGSANAAPIARDRNQLAEDAEAVVETGKKAVSWLEDAGTLIVVGGLLYLFLESQSDDRRTA